MVGACGGQRCLAGDGALNSSEMPAAKVILLFKKSPLNLRAADVKAVVLSQLWPVKSCKQDAPYFPPAASIFRTSFPAASASCMDMCLFLGCMALKWECWGRQGRAGKRETGEKLSALEKIASRENTCRSVTSQRKGNALPERFRE